MQVAYVCVSTNEQNTVLLRVVNFRSLTDSIDTSKPMGRFFFHIMGALAEMEREHIMEEPVRDWLLQGHRRESVDVAQSYCQNNGAGRGLLAAGCR